MASVKDLLRDLTAGKAVPSQPKPATPYVPPVEQEPVTNFRKVETKAEPIKSRFRSDSNGPIFVPQRITTAPPAPVAVETDVCPDNSGKPHEIQISRGKKTCWLCGADLTDRRDASTSWRASVYGTTTKRGGK